MWGVGFLEKNYTSRFGNSIIQSPTPMLTVSTQYLSENLRGGSWTKVSLVLVLVGQSTGSHGVNQFISNLSVSLVTYMWHVTSSTDIEYKFSLYYKNLISWHFYSSVNFSVPSHIIYRLTIPWCKGYITLHLISKVYVVQYNSWRRKHKKSDHFTPPFKSPTLV